MMSATVQGTAAHPRFQPFEDAALRLRNELLDAYIRDGRLAEQRIHVEIRGALVTLSGTVPTHAAAWVAISIAARMPLLRGIVNRIRVNPRVDAGDNAATTALPPMSWGRMRSWAGKALMPSIDT